jgi:hypothetical protein
MPDHLGCAQNAAMGHRTAKGRAEGNDGCDICWPLCRDGTRDYASKTVADQMNLPARAGKRSLNRCIQLLPNQKVRTLGVEPDA